MKKILFVIFMFVVWTLSGNTPVAWALIPVVPFSPQESVDVTTGPSGCGLSCQSNTQLFGNAGQSLSVVSPQPTASAGIAQPSAGLPDLSVSVQNQAPDFAQAQANYINTIKFVYTGAGTPPAFLSSSIAWTVDAHVQQPAGYPDAALDGYASISISLSTCYCPEQFTSTAIGQSGAYSLSNPFTIADGGTIAYRLAVGAEAFSYNGQTTSVSVDPQIEIALPAGWTGYLGSGGTLGAPLAAAAPEPPTLMLLAPFLALWMLVLKVVRSGKVRPKGTWHLV